MSRDLFGTDGIRGKAGSPPLDKNTVYAFGLALGEWVAHHASCAPQVVIGMDTRESGPWLAKTVAAGLKAKGVGTRFAGVTTTPGVAYLTKTQDFVAGVMISASHNPYQDNGLKVFAHNGFKLDDAEEEHVEDLIHNYLEQGIVPAEVALQVDESLDKKYLEFLLSLFHADLKGMRIVLDCANGAASQLGPELFARLGATVITMSCNPDGRNINLNCGALHTEQLLERVISEKADAGAAFDGDADRCMMVSSTGKLIDGDHVLLVAAKALLPTGQLHGRNGTPSVVATVMSNLGLEKALAGIGVSLLRTSVGDRYVLEEMIKSNLPLGGEQSGHVIFRDVATTGDGLLTALRILEFAKLSGRSLDDLTTDFSIYPQKLVNVRFKEKRPLEQLPGTQAVIQAAREHFLDRGRVLIRFSGTEPLARVMVEGDNLEQVNHWANTIAGAIANELGTA